MIYIDQENETYQTLYIERGATTLEVRRLMGQQYELSDLSAFNLFFQNGSGFVSVLEDHWKPINFLNEYLEKVKPKNRTEIQQKCKFIFSDRNSLTWKTGYLLKKRSGGVGYNRRWCVVKHDSFYYFGEKDEEYFKGVINLVGCTLFDGSSVRIESTQQSTTKPIKETNFKIQPVGSTRIFKFKAPSIIDAREWITTIKRISEGTADKTSEEVTSNSNSTITTTAEDSDIDNDNDNLHSAATTSDDEDDLDVSEKD